VILQAPKSVRSPKDPFPTHHLTVVNRLQALLPAALPKAKQVSTLHCVTGEGRCISALGGVPLRSIASKGYGWRPGVA